jgi:hypothetical protein
MSKCYMCNKDVVTEEKPGNFYIEVMNQSKDNEHHGNKPYYLWFCSWNCLEDFINQEK